MRVMMNTTRSCEMVACVCGCGRTVGGVGVFWISMKPLFVILLRRLEECVIM